MIKRLIVFFFFCGISEPVKRYVDSAAIVYTFFSAINI